MLIDATTQTVNGNVYFLTGNDDLNVGAGIVITSLGSSESHDFEYDAITTFQGQHTFTVSGTINGYDEGINTIGCTLSQTVEIFAGGVINSGYNSPVVDADGVILDGVNSTLANHGTINAQGSGVMISTPRVNGTIGTTFVTNSGTITADKYGIWVQYGDGGVNFTNTGTVESRLGSYRGGSGVDTVTNSGTMRGDVLLGGGDDLYTSLAGRVIGVVRGDGGNDRFLLSGRVDRIDGGEGIDTLDFGAVTRAMTIDLSNNANNLGGVVTGDTYTGIEIVIGGTRNDTVTGDVFDNVLIGNGGLDVLSGGIGNDTLDGGLGIDVLSGGLGSDVFVFNAATGLRDQITDFDVTVDLIRLEGSAFGYGAYTGGVSADDFVTSTRAFALDATDRFIFRTTDHTLWFDADGTGTTRAIMVADLQAGAQLTSFQLLIG